MKSFRWKPSLTFLIWALLAAGIFIPLVVWLNFSQSKGHLTDDARDLNGMWEYIQGELPENPRERTGLEFYDDGTCRCFVQRYMYNFGPDGELLSYNNFGSEDAEGRFNVIDGRLVVELPGDFSEYSPTGTITNRGPLRFHVETASGETYVFTRVVESEEL